MSILPKTEVRVYYRFEDIDADDPDPDGCLAMAEPMPTLENYEDAPVKTGFWRRQFSKGSTRGQRRFDWTFGFFLPLICFYFDPIVFRSGAWDEHNTVLGHYQIAAYFTGFITTMTLVAWLLWREKFGPAAVVPAAVLSIASVISLMIGFAIFPYSLIGAIFLVGLLGFTPLFTAFVYMRNAVRAFRTAGDS